MIGGPTWSGLSRVYCRGSTLDPGLQGQQRTGEITESFGVRLVLALAVSVFCMYRGVRPLCPTSPTSGDVVRRWLRRADAPSGLPRPAGELAFSVRVFGESAVGSKCRRASLGSRRRRDAAAAEGVAPHGGRTAVVRLPVFEREDLRAAAARPDPVPDLSCE